MPEVEGQDLVFEGLGVFDLYFGGIGAPADDVFEFVSLGKGRRYLQDVINFHDKLRDIGL